MSEVFISYRQSSAPERQRVRAFAERLRSCGIRVILDQFFLEEHPGGPNDGWDKWSSDRALHISHVIIIGSVSWFQCFDKSQPPGTGLGAACEADDIRHRVYEANGIVETIRVVLFDDADSKHISPKLKRYHRFHADRDFDNILRWLGCPASAPTPSPDLRHSTFGFPHSSLPTIQRFFGRDAELNTLQSALHPDATGWGALIDGPGGMGKTTLAIRAAELAATGHYEEIVFLSAKQTAMDPHGPHDESAFAVSGFTQMLDAIARWLQKPEITQAPAGERPRLLIDALTGTRTLLVLDNLETLTDADQRSLFAFLAHLPRTCKALLTSRPLVITTGRRLKLQQLDQTAALQTLADIAHDNPALAAAPESDRLRLITETGGNTLLLTWTAWQVGSGYCTTIADALAHLRSCPHGNDPLEFIFGDLLARFTSEEERIVATLSYPTEPILVTAIAEISGTEEPTTRRALKLLTNRSIVVPQEGEKKYALVPMVAAFIRHARAEVVKQMGERLADRAFHLIAANGLEKYDRFQILDKAWPVVDPALPIFLGGDSDRLEAVCFALQHFLRFTARWDIGIAFNEQAETRAIATTDYKSAGWRAVDAGWLHRLRHNADAVLACADRAALHWNKAKVGDRLRAIAIRLRGKGNELKGDYQAALNAYYEALELHKKLEAASDDVATDLNDLANIALFCGDLPVAQEHYTCALQVAIESDSPEGVAASTGNLATVALINGDWTRAEAVALDALSLAEGIHREDLVAQSHFNLAVAKLNMGRNDEALAHARRAVDIYKSLNSSDIEKAQTVLAWCEGEAGNGNI